MCSSEELKIKFFSDSIANACIEKYKSLSKNGKPVKNEWTVLAGVIKVENIGNVDNFKVVSLGTGSKCIGKSQLPKNGDRLHDSHAEVIARRGFKLYILEEIKKCIEGTSSIITYKKDEVFLLSDKVSFHFYCSNTPCGDASIFPTDNNVCHTFQQSVQNSLPEPQKQNVFLKAVSDSFQGESSKHLSCSSRSHMKKDSKLAITSNGSPSKKIKLKCEDDSRLIMSQVRTLMASEVQCTDDLNNATSVYDLHRTGAKCVNKDFSDPKDSGLNYHITGVLRIKPGRGDPTLSHCCSDKMFKWTVLGFQGAISMLFLKNPIYIHSLTIGNSFFNYEAFNRALFTRFQDGLSSNQFTDKISPLFCVRTPKFIQSNVCFSSAKPPSHITESEPLSAITRPSSASIIWTDTKTHEQKHEVSVDGKRLGTTKKTQDLPKSRLSICRIELFRRVVELCKLIESRKEDFYSISCGDNETFCNTDDYALNYGVLKRRAVSYESTKELLLKEILLDWTPKPLDIKNFILD